MSAMSWRPACTTTCTPGRRARPPAARRRDPLRAGRRARCVRPLLRSGTRQLDQAQQRAVAALAHELGVERDPSRSRAPRAAISAQVTASAVALTALPPAAATAPRRGSSPAARDTSVPCARIHARAPSRRRCRGERGVSAAERVQEGVPHLACGDQPLQLGDGGEHARVVGRQDSTGRASCTISEPIWVADSAASS